MTQAEFRNAICIMRSIDKHELVEAGIVNPAKIITVADEVGRLLDLADSIEAFPALRDAVREAAAAIERALVPPAAKPIGNGRDRRIVG